MPEHKKNRGEATRKTILKAAETEFAKHGFHGARVDTIAEVSSFNKTLIFRYFGDKLGLYTAVLKQADLEWSELLSHSLSQVLEDESICSDSRRFREFLKNTFEAYFDYMVDHPGFTSIFNWEQAERWKTFTGIASQFEPSDLARLEAIFSNAKSTGLIRKDLDIMVMILLFQQLCWSTPNALPLYQMLLSEKDLAPTTELDYVRDQVIEFLINGIMHNPQDDES